MSEFRSVPDEVQRLLLEIQEAKETLKTVSTRLAGIEKHVRRAFQVPKPDRKLARGHGEARSSLMRDGLLAAFDSARARFVESGPNAGEEALEALKETELRALAKELGLPNSKKLGLSKLRSSVMQRVRESAMLGTSALRGSEQASRVATSDESVSDPLKRNDDGDINPATP